MSMNIAIDGPAGAGKSTVAKQLAKELEFVYVDTGAMYRAMALYFLRNQVDPKDEAALTRACGQVEIEIRYAQGEQQVLLNGENVNGLIRSEEVGNTASATSGYAAVREKLLELQRQMAKQQDVIMDGRDIGTVVLPKAQVKIYLTASAQTRAKRRCEELQAKGQPCDLSKIKADIETRDYQDMHRERSPLKQAEDAIVVDSSDLDVSQVVGKIRQIYEERKG